MEDNKNDIKKNAEVGEVKTASKHAKLSMLWRVLLWVVLSPIILLVLLSILIYVPPVQKAAVDWASDYLSEEMGMQVTVDRVRLKFPLDLSAGGMVAVQDGDTILNAESLDLDVRMKPLFDGNVEVDEVCLKAVKVNTRNLVEACLIKGYVGELGLNSHATSLSDENAVLSKIWLNDANLAVVLADSVPEDTTESEPVTWKVQLEDIKASNVTLKLNTGNWDEGKAKWIVDRGADAMNVKAHLGTVAVNGNLDLEKEIYNINKVKLDGSSLSYSNMLALTDVSAVVDSIVYKGSGDLSLAIKSLMAKEKCGINLKELKGHVVMSDSLSKLSVPDMMVLTDDSRIDLSARMDMNAFDSINPGTFAANLKAQIGKGDILAGTKMAEPFMEKGTDLKDVRQMIAQYITEKPVELALETDGNMQNLRVTKMHAYADRLLTLDATASITDGAQIAADATASLRSARAKINADYNLDTEAYAANLQINGFRSSDWMKMAEPVKVSGTVKARGQGLDFYSAKTRSYVALALNEARMGKINLSSTEAELNLKNRNLQLDLTCDNDVLKTDLSLNGKVQKKGVDASLDIDLPLCDIHNMGLYDETMDLSTKGQFSLSSNLDNLFKCVAHVDGLDLHVGEDSLLTEDFNLNAETTVDSTYANLNTGDLSVDFHTPYNIFKLSDRFTKLFAKAEKQIKKKDLNIDELKAFFPYVYLKANVGTRNPLSAVLKTYGVSFSELKANVDMGPEKGVTGNGHLFALKYDTIKVDTTFFDIYQDSKQLTYRAGVACSDQPMFDAFRAYLDGYVSTRDIEARLTYFDKKNQKGIDLGLHARGYDRNVSDTVVHINVLPEYPIIAYRKFKLNEHNYVDICRDGHLNGDVRLESMSDKCCVSLSAGLNSYQKQWANAVIENLNLEEIVRVMPFMPKLSGMLNVDAMFNQNENDDNFWAGGTAGIQNFMYEDMAIGNLETDFNYKPEGLTKHEVQGQVTYNGVDVAYLKGLYNAENDGYLDASLTLEDIPVELFNAFIPDQVVSLDGNVAGVLSVCGPTDKLVYNGDVVPTDVHIGSDLYSVRLGLANDTISIKNSKLMFNRFKLYGAGTNPLTINGNVDFSDVENLNVSLGCYGRNFKLIEAKRSGKSVVFGDVYADFFTRVNGALNDLRIRGMLNVLNTTNVTYIMTETPLSQGDRLDDIVTFVDFKRPPDRDSNPVNKSFVGVDMQMTLNVEDGAKFNCEFSADRQSYVNVQGGGSIIMKYTPEGVLSLQGRLTLNEGEMKYTLPVIPLKTFTIENGSYIEFTGEPFNPTLNFAATERTKATVSSEDGASRSVAFDVGLKVTNTLENMGLEFTIDAPEDMAVQNELAGYSKEEKNKLAVALLATGMYLSNTNATGFSATNALNNFLQNEINNIAGQALATTVNVEMGMEQTTRDDGSTRTDYSFKFSKRFFSDRLNVVIGGKVSSDANGNRRESGAYIDDVSLEWRLDKGGSRYVRVFHEKDYSNLIEGELDKNGAGIVLRKKVDNIAELFQFGKKSNTNNTVNRTPNAQSSSADKKEDNKQDRKEEQK